MARGDELDDDALDSLVEKLRSGVKNALNKGAVYLDDFATCYLFVNLEELDTDVIGIDRGTMVERITSLFMLMPDIVRLTLENSRQLCLSADSELIVHSSYLYKRSGDKKRQDVHRYLTVESKPQDLSLIADHETIAERILFVRGYPQSTSHRELTELFVNYDFMFITIERDYAVIQFYDSINRDMALFEMYACNYKGHILEVSTKHTFTGTISHYNDLVASTREKVLRYSKVDTEKWTVKLADHK